MKFVIIGSHSTGSTHLTDLLNRQKDIVCHGELFKPRSRSGRYGLRRAKEDKNSEALAALMELRERDPGNFLMRIFAQDYGAAAVGFKIFDSQNDTVLDLLICDESVRKVVLLRRNVLAVYSSYLIAQEIGKRNFRVHHERLATTPSVNFRENHFRRFCRQYLEFYRRVFDRLTDIRQACHVVNYDQINDPWQFANLVLFIGAVPPRVRLEPRFLKQNSPDILSRFSNPDDVDTFLVEHGLTDWSYEMETSLDPFGELAGDLRPD